MKRPTSDRALPVPEKLQGAIQSACQTHWQSPDKWQQAHDPTRLLVVEPEPALPLRVHRIFVQRLKIIKINKLQNIKQVNQHIKPGRHGEEGNRGQPPKLPNPPRDIEARNICGNPEGGCMSPD